LKVYALLSFKIQRITALKISAFTVEHQIDIQNVFIGIKTPGYASTMCAVLFLGAVQLISIGVLGEYLGRLSEESKRRPVYVASEVSGPLSDKLPDGMTVSTVGIVHNHLETAEKADKAKELSLGTTTAKRDRATRKTAKKEEVSNNY